MEMLHRKANRPDADGLLAAWRQQLQTALSKPWLAAGWLAQNRALLQRFTRTYDHLRQQPRPVRRRLQRQWGASLAGAALALALLNAPAHAIPGGITVDGTSCTLVDAITAANTDATVDGSGCNAGNGADTITLQTDVTLTASNVFFFADHNGLPVISSEITIEGAGYTISRDAGAPAFRLLAVSSTGNLTLHQTTLSGGNVTNGGGAIFNRGTVTVSNSTLAGNTTDIQGGAILNLGTVTVSNSTLSGNAAARGGGIYNEGGTVTVSNSTLAGNSANNYGGGIYNQGGTLNLGRSLISGNSAGNSGAEIYNYSGGMVNAANFNLIGYGGDARSANFTPLGSDIVPSQALAAILNTTLADNGGDTLTHALVTGSPALDAAGDSGLATDQRGITRPQGSADDIGAFELAPLLNARINGTDCNLIDAIIAANSDTATGACAAGTVGADTITLLDDVTLTASNNFAVNSDNGLPIISSAITIEGAGYTISRDAGAPAFRLLLVDITGNLTLHQTTLSGGNSQQSGGAIHNLGTVTVNNSTLSGNSASQGGAIFNSYATVTVSNSTLSNNTASFAGGSIYSTSDSTVSISNSTLSGNSAEGGGAIYNYGTMSISNSTLSGNSADQGGGIYNKSGTVSISASTLSDNTANDNGGGINNRYGTLTVSNSTLSGNTASTNGGGINNDATATVSNSTLSGNSAAEGGGIYNNGTVTVNNSTLSGNSASNYGGGIYNDDTATISNSTLSGNSAAKGGGIYNDRATLTVSNSTLSGNSASSNGGGILNDRGTLNLARSLISGNSAGSGAEIHNAGGTINAANFNLIGYGGDARSANFTPLGSDIVPSQALAAILNTTLADNGGDTLTHALVTGSPALDAAGDSGLATDQRGITRPQGSADDIGAFELEVAPTTITIVLDAQPDLPTNLGFQGSFGPFLLDDPALDDSDAYTNTKSFTVAPGSYTVRRNNATGWFLTDITCTPTGKAAINLFQRRAILTVASGDSVTCTYTVQRAARILARAFNDEVRTGSNLGRRNALDRWLPDWAMSVFSAPNALVANGWTGATTAADLYQASFTTLQPGDYTVCTVLPDGSWTPTTPNAVDPAYGKLCKTVTLAPGQVATVLFGAYRPTVVASEAFTPEDELITDEDSIVDRPYDPAEDETATEEDGAPRLFLPLVVR